MRASSLKVSIIMLAIAVGLAAPVLAQDDPVTTTRDGRGVWFIEGGDLYDVFEAMGYAVATDRMFQLDLYRRTGNGRLSELLGPSQLSTDIGLRLFSYSDAELTQMFEALSPETQTAVQAYVAGINRRLAEYPTNWFLMPHEYWILSFQSVFQLGGGSVLPAPWTVNDVLHWMVTLTRFFDPEGDFASDNFGQLDNYVLLQTLGAVYPQEYLAMFTDLRWINDPGALTYIPAAAAKSESASKPMFPTLEAGSLPDLSGAAANLRARANQIESNLEAINANVKMGSYAWAVSGDKTESGNPIVYSGPQMGFETPSIVVEGSIRGGGLEVSGMTVPGIPMIIIGRTPHHAWSMQVGHAHTVDYYLEAPQSVSLHRMETIRVRGGQPVTIPIFRSPHGPVIEPFPYNPADPPDVIVSWAYAHWGKELQSINSFFKLAQAESIADFDEGIEGVAVSQHFTYADRDGNIAYWMAGYDPVRAPGVDPRFPSIGNGQQEWTGARKPRVHDVNNAQGYYGGWNNKASLSYPNATNNYSYYFGPAHRAHVIDEYLAANDNLTYEQIRDLALNIATTDSFGGGGNTWSFVADEFSAAVAA
ncbi:MAG: penicillin acylase family protein, partial [Thermoanaerobaculales bacterium]|nr:penicillin acylase family protein [Thermoanaerobaculales bacterium]